MVGIVESRLEQCGVVYGKTYSKGPKLFSNFTSFEVNNGKRVLFWHDIWCSDEPLSRLFLPVIV